jgi:hypothetical protein
MGTPVTAKAHDRKQTHVLQPTRGAIWRTTGGKTRPQPVPHDGSNGYRSGEAGGASQDFDFSEDIKPSATNGGDRATNDGAHPGGYSGSVRVAYIYHTADGAPFMKVLRTPEKTFPTYRWTGHGWAKDWPATTIPYRLPELLAAPADTPVLICEGEKDCDTAARHGFVATTNPGGAGKWRPELSQHFQGN